MIDGLRQHAQARRRRRQRPAVGIGCRWRWPPTSSSPPSRAYFLLAFVNIGLVPDGGSSPFVPARIGSRARSRWRCSASGCPAAQALEWGLINRVSPDEALRGARSTRWSSASRPARRAPTPAPSASSTAGSTAAWRSSSSSRPTIQQEMAASGDFVEGVTAFLEKRPAEFTGAADADSRIECPRLGSVLALAPIPSPPAAVLRWRLAAAGAASRPARARDGGSPNADQIRDALLGHLRVALVIFVGRRGRAALLADQVPRAAGRASRRRSTATRGSRSAGRSAPR